MPVTVDHFVLSNGDTAKYDYDGLNNKPDLSVKSTTLENSGKIFYFYKVGRLVVCNAGGDIQSLGSGYTTIGTLPNEYWPLTQVVSRIENDRDGFSFFTVGVDGVVQVYSSEAYTSVHNFAINATWISAT